MPTHTKRIDLGELDAPTVFHRLRTHVPDRAAVLLEGLPGPDGRRFAVVGYLARAEAAIGHGAAGISALIDGCLSLPCEDPPEGLDPVERWAARLSWAAFGFASAGGAFVRLGLPPWPDDFRPGHEASNLTVGVIDVEARSLTIAGRSPNVCERFAWETTHPKAPDPAPIEALEEGAPEGLAWISTDKEWAKTCGRVGLRIEMAGLPGIHVHAPSHASVGTAEPLDAYRALRFLGGADGLVCLHFAVPAALDLVGRLDDVVTAEAAAFAEPLAERLPPLDLLGAGADRRAEAAKLIRDLEPVDRGLYGGAAGVFFAGGGGIAGVLRDPLVFEAGVAEISSGADVRESADPGAVREAATARIPHLLRAVRFAQRRAAAASAAP